MAQGDTAHIVKVCESRSQGSGSSDGCSNNGVDALTVKSGSRRVVLLFPGTLDDTDVSFVVRLQVRSLGSAPFSHFVIVT